MTAVIKTMFENESDIKLDLLSERFATIIKNIRHQITDNFIIMLDHHCWILKKKKKLLRYNLAR